MKTNKKIVLGGVLVITIALYLNLFRYQMDIDGYSYEQIKNLDTNVQLSLYETVRLASSYEVLLEIYEKKDTSIVFFKEQIKAGYIKPYFVLTEEMELSITKDEKSQLESLIRANNKSFQIISIWASGCQNMKSNISTEVQFLLRRLNGEKKFCSSDILRHDKINYVLYRMGILNNK